MNYTAGELVKKYLELREAKKNLTEKHKLELAPYDQAMEAIEAVMLLKLNAEQQMNAKTEFGTAYKVNKFSCTTEDKTALFGYVAQTGKWDLLTAAVSKEALKEHIETLKRAPPGVKVTQITGVNFRVS